MPLTPAAREKEKGPHAFLGMRAFEFSSAFICSDCLGFGRGRAVRPHFAEVRPLPVVVHRGPAAKESVAAPPRADGRAERSPAKVAQAAEAPGTD